VIDELPGELAWLGDRSAPIERPPQGMTSEVVFWGDVVVKRCRDPRYTKWLRAEANKLRALARGGLPIPELRGFVDGTDDVWLVMTRLPGIPFDRALETGDRTQLVRELGALLRRIHRTPVPSLMRYGAPWHDRMMVAAGGNLAWCDGTAEQLAELSATRPAPVRERLIHGDLGLDNVLVHDGHVTGIVDWPLGDSGDPRVDVALALMERDDGLRASEHAAFYAGYGGEPVDAATRAWFERLWDFF